jgi:heme/copper-type cytochrome/quinol oxidase subunit 2
MGHDQIQLYFYISLVLGFVLGIGVLIWWAKRIWKKLLNRLEAHRSPSRATVAAYTLWYMMPALIVFILCCIPMIYFNYLLKQEDYCITVIKVNKGIRKDDQTLRERCHQFDLDALFKEAGKTAQ